MASIIAEHLTSNTATASALKYLLWDRIRNRFRDRAVAVDDHYIFEDNILPPIDKERVESHASFADMGNPDVKKFYAFFKKATLKWIDDSVPQQLAILIIPSRERVYAAWLKRHDKAEMAPEGFIAKVSVQEELELSITSWAKRNGIPIESALPDVVDAFDEAGDGRLDFYPDLGHPVSEGYVGYAKAAVRLYRSMKGLHFAKTVN